MRGALTKFGVFCLGLVPTLADRPGARIPQHPYLFLVNIEEARMQITGPQGSVPTRLQGQLLFASIQHGPAFSSPIQIAGGLLRADAVTLGGQSTGALVFRFDNAVGTVESPREPAGRFRIQARLEGALLYDALDQRLGKRMFDDYAWPAEQPVAAQLELTADYDARRVTLDGPMRFSFQAGAVPLGEVSSGVLHNARVSVPFEPLLALESNQWELCIEFVYMGDKTLWKDDLDKMIEDANQIWQKCRIRIRTGFPGETCVKVVLKDSTKEGGGAACDPGGKAGDSSVVVGRNVVDDCKKRGVATTFGQILAHELGHALGLPQNNNAPKGLMSDCAPNGMVNDDDCRKARAKAHKVHTPQALAEAARSIGAPAPEMHQGRFDFRNETGQDVTDLHIEFSTAVWVSGIFDTGMFRDFGGEGTSSLNLGRGTVPVAKGTGVGVSVSSVGPAPKCKSCYWTVGNKPVMKNGKTFGCACPE
ncbi:MAG: hypothetical protein FJW40_00885 [Acidobacteria bacterium]|nr:hypothetical protein [Acidobacteriota bacterium]